LEEICKKQFDDIYLDLIGAEPLQEVFDYILSIGIKNNSTRPELMSDF
jgi:hypothetical protein